MNDLNVLKLLKETIEFADQKFLLWLKSNFLHFCKIVDEELLRNEQQAKSIRWDDLIVRCEWKQEIMYFVDQNGITSREHINQVAVEKPCSFDIDTLNDII